MDDPARILSRGAAAFDLLESPFAVLGATPRTRLDELAALAQDSGDGDARAALRALSVPRSRLEAEVAFLPGDADRCAAVLDALRHGLALPEGLHQASRANLLAHLCAAGQATPQDQADLAALQAAPADPALLAAIAADRQAAGFPPPQPQALAAAQDALQDQHAAALLASCGADPAPRLAALIRAAPDGPSGSFLRRAAAAWARQSVAALGHAMEDAAHAQAALIRDPSAPAAEAFAARLHGWAALTLPQRLADARAGLDHEASLRTMRGWRQTGIRLSEDDHPAAALVVATALADAFADLPGQAAQLREDVQSCHQLLEEQRLAPHLAPLQAIVERMGGEPGPLLASLAKAGFGPRAKGAAKELWDAFDAACTACGASEVPWGIVRTLAVRLYNDHDKPEAALALNPGLILRADQAGRTALADRFRADQRGLLRTQGLQRLKAAQQKKQTRLALSEIRGLLPLVDDPATRDALLEEQRALGKRSRSLLILVAIMVIAVALASVANLLDRRYSATAPYRAGGQPPPRVVVPNERGQRPIPLIYPRGHSAKPPTAAPHKLTFPERANPPEERPRPGVPPQTEAQLRWCAFNDARLDGAERVNAPSQASALAALRESWRGSCRDGARSRPPYAYRVAEEFNRNLDRLHAEGRAMLEGPGP